MRRLPALAMFCPIVTRAVQPLVRAGVVAVLLAAAVLALAASSAAAQETLPSGIPDVDEKTFVIARVFACPAADTDLGSCQSLDGVTLSIVLDGNELPNGPLVTTMNPIGSYSADFLASTSQWLSIAAIGGLPEGYAPAVGSDPFITLVSDLPFQGCGGESLCQYADLVVVPVGGEEPAPTEPTDPQPAPVTSTVSIYSVLCPAGTALGDLFETCYDAPAAGMPYRAGRPNTEFPETTTATSADGFVSFAVGGGVARVIQEMPFTATISVYCTADGTETGVAIVDSGNPGLSVADVTLTGGDVRCDWYTIPTGGSEAPLPGDPVVAPAEDEDAGPAPASPTTGAGGVEVTSLPNTGTGTDEASPFFSRAVWMLVLGAAGMIGIAVIRRRREPGR